MDNLVEERVTVANGKYTLIFDPRGGLRCLRHGEEWRDLVGDGMVLALMQEVQELRKEPEYVKNIRWRIESRCEELKSLITLSQGEITAEVYKKMLLEADYARRMLEAKSVL